MNYNMNTRNLISEIPSRRIMQKLMLMIMLCTLSMSSYASDWVLDESKYKVAQYSDHLRLEVFLADLDSKNTYSKGGTVFATNGATTINLLYLEYINEGSDESQTAKVKAYLSDANSRAWFSNSAGQSDITTTNTTFWLYKWGSDYHYMTAEIDFYYPASMAGSTWKIGYTFNHSNGDSYTKILAYSCQIGTSLGLSAIDASKYTCKRTSPDNIKFTIPKLPDDIPNRVSDMRSRVCTYNVNYTYHKQDGSIETVKETYNCEKNQEKSFDSTIPESVGNPKQIDVSISVNQGVKDKKNYYWNLTSSYNKTNVFNVVPEPDAATTEFRQFDKASALSWSSPMGNNYYAVTPFIYRVETDASGNALSGKSWSKRGTLDSTDGGTMSYTDDGIQTGSFYKYLLLNVPTEWVNNGISSASLNSPDNALINRLGGTITKVLDTQPIVDIHSLRQDTTVTDKVKLTWEYSRIPVDASSVSFKVMRKGKNDTQWSEFGVVTGDAQPSAGSTLNFIDSDLKDKTTRYQYKVVLSILNDKYSFESDVITAGLLKGTTVKTFEATKGTHDATVRLSWKANPTGTANDTYVLSRRYVNSNDEFMQIHTANGKSELYTFEDNTVQPGYYYEYKVDVYSGNILQNTLYDVGFCQARGVISGRVTFGSGSAVEDVRLSLRPSNTGDDNSVQAASQYIEGASTGITWNADSAEIAKIFGKNKSYTVQMFVRPDRGLSEGAVIGNIPGIGQILVGSQTENGYKLMLKSNIEYKKFNCYSQINVLRAIASGSGYKELSNGVIIYGNKKRSMCITEWQNEGFTLVNTINISSYRVDLFRAVKELQEPIAYSYETYSSTGTYTTGITLPADIYSLLTIENSNGALTLTVNDVSISNINYQNNQGDVHLSEEAVSIEPNCRMYNGVPISFDGSLYSPLENSDNLLQACSPQQVATTTTTHDFSVVKKHSTFSIGGAEGVTKDNAFKGNFAEVRVWNHILTDKEKTGYADRVLNGRESGLMLYWPMDEGLNRYVFDASYANDMPNSRHATVGNNISTSRIVPATNQLSRYTVTNANGEYIIRGIPFVGSGSTYTLTPACGIHEFSPISRNGFIGNGNLTLNSYDFTDVSSFPVKGKVTFLNTDIPVDSVQFKIDGNLVQSKEGVYSDANGEYEISVPIGEHLIECYMNGHRFTSFPLDGTKHDFKKAETVNFVDSTLVNVTGRINGGFSDQDAPLAFHRSVNRLGKATIKLSLGKEANCSFNYIIDDHGKGTYGTTDIPVESATDSIKSTAYRAGGNKPDETNYIYITTDAATGEFSAMLPPLKYKVESIKFVNGKAYDDLEIFSQNLPVIDATNTIDEKMKKDTLSVGDVMRSYKYSAKMIRQYRADPTITVKQYNMKNGAFGERVIAVSNIDNTVDSVEVLTYTDKGYRYNYGHPIFLQNKMYDFGIDVFESYKNLDTEREYKEIPKDAVFTIMNDASSTTTVFGEKATVGSEEVEVGEAYKTMNIQVTPDSVGHIAYQWEGGWPNLAKGNLRNLSISSKIDGRTYMWHAPDSQSDALDLILLGGIGSGTNFVTSGPDAVDMIIRRPPGSTSVASITNKEINSTSFTHVENTTKSVGTGFFLSETPTWEVSTGAVLGIATLTKSKLKAVSQQTEIISDKWSDSEASNNSSTYTVTDAMTTPSQMVIDLETMKYVPESGDTYIGRSTNLLFSKGRILGLFKQNDGSFKIAEKDGLTVSENFGTTFIYPQAYILNTLIPNWKAIIRSKLEEGHITADHWDKNNTPVVDGKVMYYTKYTPEDAEFGHANGDVDFWSNEQLAATNGFPSYRMIDGTKDKDAQDEVEYAINQIKIWQERIADNERDKLEAINNSSSYYIDNFSIASGSKVSQTTESSNKSSKSHSHSYTLTWDNDMKSGIMFNDAGVNFLIKSTISDGNTNTMDVSNTTSKSIAWTMSDSDLRTALSVDVYNSPSGWGPIFITRGGQTANPYEDASYTKFYQKGTKLNEATMQVEKPQLKVIGSAELTDIPTGSEAKFTLQLSNQSETNDICNYILGVKQGTNPNGAILTIDGVPLSNGKTGRLIKLKGGQVVESTLIVAQSDRSITNYENIVLQLKSEKDPSVSSEDVKLRVEFVPASSHIDLAIDHTIINQGNSVTGATAKLYNLNRQDEGLQGVRLRYRRKGTDSWTLIKQWTSIETLLPLGYEPLPEGSQFTESVKFHEDGIYEVQAQTFGLYGNAEVTYESEIVELTQDTHGPKILGMVSPEDGQLTFLNRNNMHLRFNELLNGNALSKTKNFLIEGGLNNVVSEGLYPDVAAQLNGKRIETDALYDLTNSDYAFDMWFYRQGDGTIISIGTENNLLSLSTTDNGRLQARVGDKDDVYQTDTWLPANKWIYMALNYKHKSTTDNENRLSMLYVLPDDKAPRYVGKNVTAKELSGHGKLGVGGDGMQGMIAALSIWNSDITADELYESRNRVRASYSPGLVGYWRMDEGHGTQLTDRARSRNMHMDTESWYINNVNYAAHISGEEGSALKVDISSFNPSKTDNYAFEMWFRGNEEDNQGKATLLSAKNGSTQKWEVTDSIFNEELGRYQYTTRHTVTETRTTLGFDEGRMKLKVLATETVDDVVQPDVVMADVILSSSNYCDSHWHHLAFNVRRGTSAIIYIDGQPVKVLSDTGIPGISSHYMMIGGDISGETDTNRFTGDVDDVRIWSAALDGNLIADRMYERMDNSYPGLAGYFPMEEIHRSSQGNIVSTFTGKNFGTKGSVIKLENQPEQSVNAPALKPGSTKMQLDETQFNFTASADEIYFSFPDQSLPLMDNNDFVATVDYIKDEHGNDSETVSWMFHADFACVSWVGSGVTVTDITKEWDKSYSWKELIFNSTGTSQYYEISGLPTWMTVNKPMDYIRNYYDEIEFTISPSAPIGKHTEYIYLTDHLGIQRVLQVNVTVTGNAPEDWVVNQNRYESNMTVTGQVYVGDKICENTETMIAAFDAMDHCCGVAKPRYVSTRDAYFVDMIVYGASATDLSTGRSNITFKMYDASTGITYPIVELTMPDGTQSESLTYLPDALVGSYDAPIEFRSTEKVLQTVSLPKGWTWMSIYVQPHDTDIRKILPQSSSELGKYQYVKSKTAFASAVSNGSSINGLLTSIEPGNMYKVQVSSNTTLEIYGKTIDVTQSEQTIHHGFNWIGSVSGSIMSPDEAFADLQPEVGDMVKNRKGYAVYGERGTWEGLLTSIVPGEGYLYQSKSNKTKTFHYPRTSNGSRHSRRLAKAKEYGKASHFVPVDDSPFPDNMTFIAVVEKDGERIEDAEVGAFVNGECRGAVSIHNGYYFLTVMGSSSDDEHSTVELRVWSDGKEYVIENEKRFVSDSAYGTLEAPYVLSLDNVTGIRTITDDDDDREWYTLQGFKIAKRPTHQGIYIHHGEKVRVK